MLPLLLSYIFKVHLTKMNFWLLISCLVFVIRGSIAEKLNERRILLPYNSGVPTNFTLEASSSKTACYKWSSSRPDIVTVRHLGDPTCSSRAIVTVVSRVPKRQSSVITAHDLKTNLQMRCDVEIDVINRIALTTTTRKIVYGELPEIIKAVAFDQANDTFTSIGGLQFDWTITPLDVIRYRTFASSAYVAPDFVEYWEAKGAKSSNVLMEGIRTGSAHITARISGEAYKTVDPSEITMHVVANLLLIPSDNVFLVRGAKVGFRAEITKQGPRVPLQLPLPQYYLDVIDPAIAYFDEASNLLEATEEGHTSLVLRDRNVVDEEGQSETRTEIHVMRPSYLSMTISPGEKFALRNDTVYTVTLTLHDDWHHRLYSSDNLNLSIDFPADHFDVLESTLNGTYYIVRTRDIGGCKLKAQFHGAGDAILDSPLEHSQEVTIYSPISLNPPQIFLPWIPAISPSYTVYVDALGATGEYSWETGDESMARVKYSSSGLKSSRVTVYTKGQGEVAINCLDVHNSLMFNARMNIYIRPIEAIEIMPSIVENHIGGNVILPVAVLGHLNGKDGPKLYFDDCEQVQFDVEIVEKNRIRYQPDVIMPGIGPNSCRSLTFECLESGNSRIWISVGPGKQITISAIIGCYAPLKLVHPADFAVLSLGSTIDVAFEGGPRPWSMLPEGHYTKATTSNSSLVMMREIKDRYRYNKDLHVFRTQCTGYGETVIDLEVGNQPSATLARPAFTAASVRIICAKPETLIVRPKAKSTCPQQDFVFTHEKNRDIELEIQVLDNAGQAFYNFSTLYFEWSKDGNGYFKEAHGVMEVVNGAKGYQVLTGSYQQLSGLTTVRSKVRGRIGGYQGSYFGDRFDVRREIELVLTDPLTTEKDDICILKHSSHKQIVSIENGSGYFAIDYTNKAIVDVEFKSSSNIFNIIPKSIGNGVITISDLCLNYPSLQLAYSVVDAIDVKVNLIDKIELGGEVNGEFFVLDNRGVRLHSSLHSMLDFVAVPSNTFLSISNVKPKDEWKSMFTVKAERLGLSKIVIQSQSNQIRPVQSTPIEIQIFLPLQIVPSNITLIVGNHFQATFIGGPQTQRNIEFSIEDNSLATVAPNGLIKALRIGKTRLTGRLLSVDNFEYSRAEVDVHVVPLRKIKIWAPVNQLLVGSSMPLYVIGSVEQWETPFMFGAADPAIKISWSLSNEKIAAIEGSFEEDGVTDSTTNQISARFRAKSIGVATVKVRVEVTAPASNKDTEQIIRNTILVDSIQVNVYSEFAFNFFSSGSGGVSTSGDEVRPESGSAATKVLLLSPNADLLLHFNHLDRIAYKVVNGTSVKVINSTELILRAGDAPEHAQLVLHRDMHRTGVIEFFSYAIHVDKVRYLSLRFDAEHRSKRRPRSATAPKIDVLPIGSEVNMVVQYFDNHGRQFDAVKSNLKWAFSRNDIVTLLSRGGDGSLLKVRALKEGVVIVRVYDEVNGIGSYYKFSVGSIIEPSAREPTTLLVGDIVCLRCRLASSSQLSLPSSAIEEEEALLQEEHGAVSDGMWSVEPRSVGYISPISGTFVALNPGKATVMFNSTAIGLSTYTTIIVTQLGNIQLELPAISSGITTTSTLSIPIKGTNSGDETSTITSMIAHNSRMCSQSGSEITATVRHLRANHLLPFTCDASFANSPIINSLWEAEVQFHIVRNQWQCVLIPLQSAVEHIENNIAIFNQNVTITAMTNTAASPDNDPFNLEAIGFHQLTLPYLPPFQCSTKQLILTSDSNEARFSLDSVESVLRDLVIKSSNDDILAVQKLEIVDHSMKVVVTLRNADIFSNDVSNLHLSLVSALTNQTERIAVQIKLYGTLAQLPSKILSPSFYYYAATLIAFTIALILGVGFIVRFVLSRQLKFGGPMSPDSSFNSNSVSFAGATSPSSKSPRRIVDYQPLTGRDSGGSPNNSLHRGARLSTSLHSTINNQSIQEPHQQQQMNNATFGSPSSSPRVGRPLFSTRQYYQ